MRYLVSEAHLSRGDSFRVHLESQARVLVMDPLNYGLYRQGRGFNAHGGWAVRSPITLAVPHTGMWYAVVDLDGRSGSVRASVDVLQN